LLTDESFLAGVIACDFGGFLEAGGFVSASRGYHAPAGEAAKNRSRESGSPSSALDNCAIVDGIATTLADRAPMTGPI
jgi:hypothetical protein